MSVQRCGSALLTPQMGLALESFLYESCRDLSADVSQSTVAVVKMTVFQPTRQHDSDQQNHRAQWGADRFQKDLRTLKDKTSPVKFGGIAICSPSSPRCLEVRGGAKGRLLAGRGWSFRIDKRFPLN